MRTLPGLLAISAAVYASAAVRLSAATIISESIYVTSVGSGNNKEIWSMDTFETTPTIGTTGYCGGQFTAILASSESFQNASMVIEAYLLPGHEFSTSTRWGLTQLSSQALPDGTTQVVFWWNAPAAGYTYSRSIQIVDDRYSEHRSYEMDATFELRTNLGTFSDSGGTNGRAAFTGLHLTNSAPEASGPAILAALSFAGLLRRTRRTR